VFLSSSGNVIGYHVTQPCTGCLEACNNGHFWMFLSSCVTATERIDTSTGRPFIWAQAHMFTEETDPEFYDSMTSSRRRDIDGTDSNSNGGERALKRSLSIYEVHPCR
jgi:hypothetical protein